MAYGANTFVAVSANKVITSPDGIAWIEQAVTGGWTSVAYAGTQFVAVGSSGTDRAMTSTDGLTWTLQSGLSTAGYQAVTHSDDTYVAVGQQWAAHSNDGVTWTEVNIDPVDANQWRSVAHGDDTFVALNYNTGTSIPVMTSNDGVTWTQRTSGINVEQWNGITYAAGIFVAVGSSGAQRVMTSSDGVNWTGQTAPGSEVWRAVTYADGQFVAVGHSGAVMTSPDGMTWTGQISGNSGIWRSVISGPQLVAVGQTNGLPVMTSFTRAAPAIVSVTPATGSTLGGEVLTFTGTGFVAGAVVDIGGLACTGVTVVSGTQMTCTSPGGQDGPTSVTVTNPDSQADTSVGIFGYVTPTPEPVPAVPAGPPTAVIGIAGDASASVRWAAPASTGSFPVTTYQVMSSPSGASCLTTVLTCEVTGLTNGTDYTFTVRALTGAGWSSWSQPSAVVTPKRPVDPSIMINGSCGEVRGSSGIIVNGTSTGMGMGAVLAPWMRFDDQTAFTEGRARILVDESGEFTWQRRTQKTIHVQLRTPDGSMVSNTITIRRR